VEDRHVAASLGERFVQALAAKDFDRVASLLHPEVDFRGMTPGRCWEANTATQVIEEILRSWFEDGDQIDELLQVDTSRVADRERVGYRLAVSNSEGSFLVEQQAYYETGDGSITWMRMLCSGFRPVAASGTG
jgi:hypothetical protein